MGIHRRTYGYRDKKDQEEKKEPEIEIKAGGGWLAVLGYILVVPFRVLWVILRFFWRLRPSFNPNTKRAIRAKLGWLILTLVVLGLLGGTLMIAWASRNLPDPDKLTERQVAQSTKIYDRTGEHILYEVFSDQKRTLVKLDQLPKNLINGVIATEDKDFYKHNGIEPLGWVRAVVYGIIKQQRIGGTSTITQQLVRNAILTTERSYLRKIKEIILSLRLEQKYSKDQILQIYFNEIPYGSTNYGVESAAQSYFGKHVSDLNLQECATLAGLPKSPSTYLNNSKALKDRRDFVLERMFQEGYLTRAEADKAQAEPLTLQKSFGDIKAPHFVLYVKDQLINKFGEQTVDSGGLKVITTLDWEKQQIAEKTIKDFVPRLKEGQADNAALVALDPETSQVLAMVGSVDFGSKEIDGQFNVATQGKRQPGSSFKPIIYTALFEKGYTPDTILWDVNRNFAASGNAYEPRDYDSKERGPVTIRQALQGSLNIPAVEALYLLGPKNGVTFAERLGYTTLSEGEFGLSLVLGGGEVKLIDHTNAYAIFANNGVKNETASILKVENPDGEILYEWKQKEGEKVLDEKITATISNVLSDDAARQYVFGAGNPLSLPGRTVAAKTGTTNNYRDAWTVGYTPSLVAGVWVGNTDNKEMKKGDGGSRLAAPIWNKFMSESLKNVAPEIFPVMPENDANKPILRGSLGGGVSVNVNKVNGKIATSSTPAELVETRIYYPAHSILYYVNKDDPRGAPPTNSALDSQYSIWENAIQDWVKRTREKDPSFNMHFEEPPNQYDDGSLVYDLPQLIINNPSSSSTINNRLLKIKITVSAPRGIAKVSYKLDDKYLQVIKESPFDLEYYLTNLDNGFHILYVTAEDTAGIKVEKQVDFILDVKSEKVGVNWSEANLKINQNQFPKTLYLNYLDLAKIAGIKIYRVDSSGSKSFLGDIDLAGAYNNQLTFVLASNPGMGVWQLLPEVKLKDGTVVEMGKLQMVVE